jgi:hypothetical protein
VRLRTLRLLSEPMLCSLGRLVDRAALRREPVLASVLDGHGSIGTAGNARLWRRSREQCVEVWFCGGLLRGRQLEMTGMALSICVLKNEYIARSPDTVKHICIQFEVHTNYYKPRTNTTSLITFQQMLF